jgi:hypothetical protein
MRTLIVESPSCSRGPSYLVDYAEGYALGRTTVTLHFENRRVMPFSVKDLRHGF